tara:strand:+ start:2100 stop:2345 length:246 start_codon:yes stop_codon:yes gene_type:complete
MSLTGNPKIDMQILNELTDNELKKVSNHNRYVNSICRSDTFWKERILSKYPEMEKLKKYLDFHTYKELYEYLKELPDIFRY